MSDKLVREKLRVERDLVGEAHPFIVTSITVRRGSEIKVLPPTRENPYTSPLR
jgi:hypothetical protein